MEFVYGPPDHEGHWLVAGNYLRHSLSIRPEQSVPFYKDGILPVDINRSNKFRIIGAGKCGTVFEIPGFCEVIKRAYNGNEIRLWNECVTHQHVADSFASKSHLLGTTIQVPRCYSFVKPCRCDFWRNYKSFFPTSH